MADSSATALAQAEELLAHLAMGLPVGGHVSTAELPTVEQIRSALQRERAALQGYRDHLHTELRDIDLRLAELDGALRPEFRGPRAE